MATETTERDINEFYPQDQTKNSKAFIRFQNFNELFQFVFNEYYNIDFTSLPQAVIFINDITDISTREVNFNLLNRCFEKLFEKNIGLAMRLTSTNEFESIKEIIFIIS